jgi:hypothetical protein
MEHQWNCLVLHVYEMYLRGSYSFMLGALWILKISRIGWTDSSHRLENWLCACPRKTSQKGQQETSTINAAEQPTTANLLGSQSKPKAIVSHKIY